MAEIVNFNPAGGVLTDKDFAVLIDKTLDQVRKVPANVVVEGEKYFVTQKTVQKEYKLDEVTNMLDLPPENEDTDHIPLMQPLKGFPKTFTTVNYRAGIAVTDDMKATQYHRMLGAMINGLPNAARQRKEYLLADVFNGAFTSTTGADGAYMIDDTHNHRDPEAGTWDNKMTASLPSQAALTVMWRLMQNLTNDKGHPAPVNLKKIVTGVTNWTELKRILSSSKEAENSLNAENIWNGVISLDEPYHYLTSTTAWFGQGDLSEQADGLMKVVRVPENYKKMYWSSNPDLIYGNRVKFSMTAGCLHAKNWAGNAGA